MSVRQVLTALACAALLAFSGGSRKEFTTHGIRAPITRIYGAWFEIDMDGDGSVDAFGGSRQVPPPNITAADLNEVGMELRRAAEGR